MDGGRIVARSGVRGPLAAVLSVAAALAGHVSAGGAVPGAAGILVPLALTVAVSAPVLARRSSPVRLALVIALGQVAFHELFIFGAPASTSAAPVHLHHGAHLALSGGAGPAHQHLTFAMLAAHAVSTVLTTAVLFRGERLLDTVVAHARAVVRRLLGDGPSAPALDAPRLRGAIGGLDEAPRSSADLGVHAARGPPRPSSRPSPLRSRRLEPVLVTR